MWSRSYLADFSTRCAQSSPAGLQFGRRSPGGKYERDLDQACSDHRCRWTGACRMRQAFRKPHRSENTERRRAVEPDWPEAGADNITAARARISSVGDFARLQSQWHGAARSEEHTSELQSHVNLV